MTVLQSKFVRGTLDIQIIVLDVHFGHSVDAVVKKDPIRAKEKKCICHKNVSSFIKIPSIECQLDQNSTLLFFQFKHE